MRDSYALIDLNNLKFNYYNLRRKTKKSKFLAVVKADAYGHGAVEISKFLSKLKPSPDYFGVALFEEAIELRNNGINKPIIVFDVINIDSLCFAQKYNLTISITDKSDFDILTKFFNQSKDDVRLNAHIKINTGMNRLGIRWDSDIEDILKFYSLSKLKLSGIYTHFATSDIPNDNYAKLQLKRFKDLLNELSKKIKKPGIVHAANSGAILNFPDSYFNMVRAGISLYGYKPDLSSADSVKLKPVMSIISKIASVIEVKKGESVSYGQRYFTKKDTKIASVSFGYADGYLRALSNKGRAIIKNKFYNQVGTVTMDRIMFDVGADKISVGDEVILLGKRDNKKFDAWDWSKILKTIPYEITCNISKRVPRVYVI
jgi:alanine racemase